MAAVPQIQFSPDDVRDPHGLERILRQVNVVLQAFAVSSQVTQTMPLAKLTVGGTTGSLTITDGVVTAFTLPT